MQNIIKQVEIKRKNNGKIGMIVITPIEKKENNIKVLSLALSCFLHATESNERKDK